METSYRQLNFEPGTQIRSSSGRKCCSDNKNTESHEIRWNHLGNQHKEKGLRTLKVLVYWEAFPMFLTVPESCPSSTRKDACLYFENAQPIYITMDGIPSFPLPSVHLGRGWARKGNTENEQLRRLRETRISLYRIYNNAPNKKNR